jgi:hypothetical protein
VNAPRTTILIVGNSIFNGHNASSAGVAVVSILAQALAVDALAVEFVGSQTDGLGHWHEAHDGMTVQVASTLVANWVRATRPDIFVSGALGINDFYGSAASAQSRNDLEINYRAMLTTVRAISPQTELVMGDVPFNAADPAFSAYINARLRTVCVDLGALFVPTHLTAAQMSDAVHPKDDGHTQLAVDYRGPLKGLLYALGATP